MLKSCPTKYPSLVLVSQEEKPMPLDGPMPINYATIIVLKGENSICCILPRTQIYKHTHAAVEEGGYGLEVWEWRERREGGGGDIRREKKKDNNILLKI